MEGPAAFLRVVALGVTLYSATAARAVSPDEVLSDPKLEARARAISGGLRCPKCQSESIDQSNADIAKDLRLLVRERLKAGDTDEQVKDFLVARYGEFVLLKPRFGGHTLVLWLAPFAALALGGFMAWRLASRRGGAAPAQPAESLDESELKALDTLLAGGETPDAGAKKAK
jgi:cytochrome c-type biogenesis protein CcmH